MSLSALPRFPFGFLRLLAVAILAFVGVGVAPAQQAADQATSGSLASYTIRALGDLQLEVWLSGQRLGFTPLTVKLPEGRFRLTASGESLIPYVGVLDSKGAGEYSYTVPSAPLTVDNYAAVSQDFVRVVLEEGDNAHLLIMGLHMMTDPEEGRRLLERADKALPGDGVVDALRAKVLLKAGDRDGALVAAERAVRKEPKVAFCWRVHAEVLESQQDLKGALSSLNQAMLLDPNGWRTLRVRSRVNRALGNQRAAEVDEARAQELYEALHRAIELATRQQKQKATAGAAAR